MLNGILKTSTIGSDSLSVKNVGNLQPLMTSVNAERLLTNEAERFQQTLQGTRSFKKLADFIRRSTNNQLQCSMFCGGRKCKYDCSDVWSEKQRAIPIIYSNWITDDILAMSRPNTEMIVKKKLVELFKNYNIKTVINLQSRGEHSFCGPPLEQSGFSYDPKVLMEQKIYFYNFDWKDFAEVSEKSLLDMVKVVAFALLQGKVAIHCHAGLGRTGTLIAAYLIFAYHCSVPIAVNFVRSRRPRSIQTRNQIEALFNFFNYITPCFIIYKQVSSIPLKSSLNDFLKRQNILLHGEELRILRYIPKIVFVICEKLKQLCSLFKQKISDCDDEYGEYFTKKFLSQKDPRKVKGLFDLNFVESTDSQQQVDNKQVFSPGTSSQMSIPVEEKNSLQIDWLLKMDQERTNFLHTSQQNKNLSSSDYDLLSRKMPSNMILRRNSVLLGETYRPAVKALVIDTLIAQPRKNSELNEKIYDYQNEINNKPSGWNRLYLENDLELLCALLLSWFESLDVPFFDDKIIRLIQDHNKDQAIEAFFKLDQFTKFTLEYLLRFLIDLSITNKTGFQNFGQDLQQTRLIARFLASFTLKKIQLFSLEDEVIPKEKSMWLNLKNPSSLVNFLFNVMDIIRIIDQAN